MKIIITQPNYGWMGRRLWKAPPYSLAILNSCVKKKYDSQILDPSYRNMNEDDVARHLKQINPDVVAISSISTEYIDTSAQMTALVRKTLPNAKIILGGILPTVILDVCMRDRNVDYWLAGEGEIAFLQLLKEFEKSNPDFSSVPGLAYWKYDIARINPPAEFIKDLDSVPLPDYGNLDLLEYGREKIHSSAQMYPKQFPYTFSITSRGCPYPCVFCAGATIFGKRIRYRSAENVLSEVDMFYKMGIREVIFVDDHFLGNRERAKDIMNGLIERNYDLTWKCINLHIAHLDEEILKLMKESGSYQMTVSLESGNQHVLDKIIKKPINLKRAVEVLKLVRELGIEIIANFVIGFPDETWEQVRDTIRFAERLDVDLVNFHIATPLPKTELFEVCLKKGILPKDFDWGKVDLRGYTQGVIETSEFSSFELAVLRAFEWDRINFSSEERKRVIARMHGLELDQLEKWRKDTRRKLGIKVVS